MNKYEKKAALIIMARWLLVLLWATLLYTYPLPMCILTAGLPVIYVLIIETLVYWERLSDELKQQDK